MRELLGSQGQLPCQLVRRSKDDRSGQAGVDFFLGYGAGVCPLEIVEQRQEVGQRFAGASLRAQEDLISLIVVPRSLVEGLLRGADKVLERQSLDRCWKGIFATEKVRDCLFEGRVHRILGEGEALQGRSGFGLLGQDRKRSRRPMPACFWGCFR